MHRAYITNGMQFAAVGIDIYNSQNLKVCCQYTDQDLGTICMQETLIQCHVLLCT